MRFFCVMCLIFFIRTHHLFVRNQALKLFKDTVKLTAMQSLRTKNYQVYNINIVLRIKPLASLRLDLKKHSC